MAELYGRHMVLIAVSLASCATRSGAGEVGRELPERVLTAHNRERALVGVPSLTWDERLAAGAKGWADHLGRTGRFEHSPEATAGDSSVGENIWAGTSGFFSPEQMVEAWRREKKHFLPGVFPRTTTTGNVSDVGHYTQMIWRRSRSVGCAIAKGAKEDVLVCRYAEAGNVVGEPVF